MKVLKFGGTSVGSSSSIRDVMSIVKGYHDRNEKICIVVSAFKGITNQLNNLGAMAAKGDESYLKIFDELEKKHVATIKDLLHVKIQSAVIAQLKRLLNELEEILHGVFLLRELSDRTLDLVQSFGERASAQIIAAYLSQEGIPSDYCDTRHLIKTDGTFGAAKVNFDITKKNLTRHFKANSSLQVLTGFISSTENDETTTLGRGGSDYTAAIAGACLEAKEIEIWTDVDGVMTADPRRVKNAFSLPSISYVEAMEMSYFGAKVIYPPTLQPAFGKKIPIRIKNTFNPNFPGTLIKERGNDAELAVKGISSIERIALINVAGSGMVGVPGVSSRLFGALAGERINIILITQASSEHSICFAVAPKDAETAKKTIEREFELEINANKIDNIVVEEDLSIVAIIGENMRHTPGISGKLFNAMGKNGINVVAIAQGSSELNVSVVININDLAKALNALHDTFFLSDVKKINLFMVGTGLIGETLLRQIQKQADYLLEHLMLEINVVALANSRNYHFDEGGISLAGWKEKIDFPGDNTRLRNFVDTMKGMNLPNSIFVDCTSSQEVIKYYHEILEGNISIVTPNKLANSSSYADYDKLQKTAFKKNIKFLYETNVGAGLPVIGTLKDLKHSGDQILKIEGILSGTLSYIFNNYVPGEKFGDVVREAKEKGFTEPDPRDDLNGMDVARKILILAREAGFNLEPNDVKVIDILPESCLQANSIDKFFDQLEAENAVFEKQLKNAEKKGQKLRFIATLQDNKALVELKAVGPEHPFYSLSGSDNMISFTTERYKERPLVIKGPGAGAEVTAAGVFAEIISISNYIFPD